MRHSRPDEDAASETALVAVNQVPAPQHSFSSAADDYFQTVVTHDSNSKLSSVLLSLTRSDRRLELSCSTGGGRGAHGRSHALGLDHQSDQPPGFRLARSPAQPFAQPYTVTSTQFINSYVWVSRD